MSDGMGRELAYLSSHATNRYFIPNWGSYSKIDAALRHDRNEEHMNLMPKACRIDTPSAPSGTAQSESFNGSLGLLNGGGSSYNAADAEANQEMADILRRKKKRKRGMRL